MLTREAVLLACFCDELDGVSFDSLPGRIAFQKRIYLLQACGVDLGYRFTWDLHGPYSRGLAVAGAELAADLEAARQIATRLQLTADARVAIERARELASPPDAVEESVWLEFVASLHFLYQSEGHGDPDLVFDRLVELKPHMAPFRGLRTEASQRLSRLTSRSA